MSELRDSFRLNGETASHSTASQIESQMPSRPAAAPGTFHLS
ncbi:MAG: hypothetical protein V8S69_02005 [Dakarella massiliensis]